MDENAVVVIQHSKPTITLKDIEAVSTQLASGNIASDKMATAFEEAMLNYINVSYGTFTDSGSKALKLALNSLAIQAGDEIVLPTYVCHSVIDAVISTGATPVLCDVSDEWNICAEDVEAVITSNTKAIILVHTMGIALDVNAFKKFNIPLIEDCCQALGSVDEHGQMVGTAGDISVYSFHAIKCITTGEGGFVATNNASYYDRINAICKIKADKGSVTDLQATLGLSQLNAYPENIMVRKNIATSYFNGINNKQLTASFKNLYPKSNCYRFLLTSDVAFNDCKAFFETHGIAVRKGVDELLHITYPRFAKGSYTNAEQLFRRTVSIPIYPDLSHENMQYIIEIINRYDAFR